MTSMSSSEPASGLYHERQRLLCCGAHALNCLFQAPWIDAARMDALAARVAAEQGVGGTGAFRSWLPRLGNYDISVLAAALGEGQGARFSLHLLANAVLPRDLEALGARLLREQQQQEQQEHGQQETTGKSHGGARRGVVGVLVNIRSRNRWSRALWEGRHWLALRRSPGNGLWYDLDSKLPAPAVLGDVGGMLRFVRRCIEEEDGQAFVVEVGSEGTEGGEKASG